MHNKVNLIWMDFFIRCHWLSNASLIYEPCGHYFWEMFYVKGFCGQVSLGNIAPFISVMKIHDVHYHIQSSDRLCNKGTSLTKNIYIISVFQMYLIAA